MRYIAQRVKLIIASPQQAAARDALTHTAWGTPLTVDQFQAREHALRSHRWSRAVMTTWLWVDAADQVLSSCETFQMPSQCSSGRGVTFAIASVFTEPSLRGRGAAEAMLSALHARLRGWAGAQAAVLFSEIGPTLYARLGYRGIPSVDVLFEPSAETPTGLEWGLRLPGPDTPAPEALQIAITADQLDWHHERSRFYARALGRVLPAQWGASCGDGSIGWTANFRTNELMVLFTRGSPAELRVLIRAASWVAGSVGLGRVRVWQTTPLEGGERVAREDLPMICSLGAAFETWSPIDRALWV